MKTSGELPERDARDAAPPAEGERRDEDSRRGPEQGLAGRVDEDGEDGRGAHDRGAAQRRAT